MKRTTEKFSEEGYAYTPGLKVKPATIVSKVRKLPIPGEVYVKVGDEVNYDTVVARTQLRGDPEVVNAAALLGIENEDLMDYMKKKGGDQASKGEEIAGYTALFGLIKKKVTSPIDGIVESISETTGQVVIRGLPIPIDINAYIPGKVIEVLPTEGAVIETNAAFIQGIFGVGGETHGKIKVAVDSPDKELTADYIRSEDKGTILIGGSRVTLEALKKAAEVGASCIVTGGILYKDLTTLLGGEIGVAITGQEEVGFTLIITEGFGKMMMSQRTFNLLRRFEGYMASVNGATQIRAGVLRPEIVISHKGGYEQAHSEELDAGIVLGTTVRIIGQPYFGVIGRVVRLPAELQQVETRSYVRVLDVELEDGRVVTVPRANVEIIEE